jgi:hypothetical protein
MLASAAEKEISKEEGNDFLTPSSTFSVAEAVWGNRS